MDAHCESPDEKWVKKKKKKSSVLQSQPKQSGKYPEETTTVLPCKHNEKTVNQNR